jgi:hypothetical protein
MRQIWFFVNWINDRSGVADRLYPFLKGEQYKIVHRFGAKQLNFYLPRTPKDLRNVFAPAEPAYYGQKVNTGTGSVDIALYKIGEDETAYTLKVAGRTSAKPWDSICAVFIKIGVEFGYDRAPGGGKRYVNRADGTPKKWDDATGTGTFKSDWQEKIESNLKKLQKRFWVEDLGASNRNFRNTYIHFFPIVLADPFKRYDDLGNLVESVVLQPFTNYDIVVRLNDTASIGTRVNKILQVGNDTNTSWIVHYMVGRDDGSAAPTTDSPVDILDLGFLQTWLRTKLGSSTLRIRGA